MSGRCGFCEVAKTATKLLGEAKPQSVTELRPKMNQSFYKVKKKGKAIPVTGRGGPQGCETLRLPHFL
jgi:hypothetical protein